MSHVRPLSLAVLCSFLVLGCAGSAQVTAKTKKQGYSEPLGRTLLVYRLKLPPDVRDAFFRQMLGALKQRNIAAKFMDDSETISLDPKAEFKRQVESFGPASIVFLNPKGGLVSSNKTLLVQNVDLLLYNAKSGDMVWRAFVKYSLGAPAAESDAKAKVLVEELVKALEGDQFLPALAERTAG